LETFFLLCGYPVVAIGDGIFCETCFSDVTIPEGVAGIGDRAFASSYYLTAITIPESVAFIGEDAFEAAGDFSVHGSVMLRVAEGSYAAEYAKESGIPYTYDMDYKAFFTSDGYLYTVADGEAIICGYAGDAICLMIPDDLDGFPVSAFGDSCVHSHRSSSLEPFPNLISVTIPAGMTDIGQFLFVFGTLERIDVSSNNPSYASIDGVLFDKELETLILCPVARKGMFVIPEGIKYIADYAFHNCSSLTEVTLPSSVQSIGRNAFDGCTGLTEVILPDCLISISNDVFSECYSLFSSALGAGYPPWFCGWPVSPANPWPPDY